MEININEEKRFEKTNEKKKLWLDELCRLQIENDEKNKELLKCYAEQKLMKEEIQALTIMNKNYQNHLKILEDVHMFDNKPNDDVKHRQHKTQ